MGGNTRAIDRSTEEVKTFAGRPAFADKTDFRSVDRSIFKRSFISLFKKLDDLHNRMFDAPIWDKKERDKLLSTGQAFNGSSEHLFGNMSDEEFVRHKPVVGDIDLTVPAEKIGSIFDLLTSLEGSPVTNDVVYIGQNKPKQSGHQINALFSYRQPESERDIFVQVDFEAVEYVSGKPEEFSKFGHSSSWEDVQAGVKGVFHKYMLRALSTVASQRDDVVLLTPTSPLSPPEKIKIKKVSSPAHLLSFSVDRGLRANAVQQFLEDGSPVVVTGKFAYKEIEPSQSDYKRTRREIFSLIFQKEPSTSDLVKLDSFIGLLRLVKENLPLRQADEIFLYFVENLLFGKGQALDASNPEVDRSSKMAAVSKFTQEFPSLSRYEDHLQNLQKTYYASYKTRAIIESLLRRYIREILKG